MKNLAITGTALFLLIGCTGAGGNDDVPASALEVDGNGLTDCVDLDQTLSCVHHPTEHGCARADVNGDGTVDGHDAQAVHSGLAKLGHSCPNPDGHLADTSGHASAHHADGGHDEDHHLAGSTTSSAHHGDGGSMLLHDAGH